MANRRFEKILRLCPSYTQKVFAIEPFRVRSDDFLFHKKHVTKVLEHKIKIQVFLTKNLQGVWKSLKTDHSILKNHKMIENMRSKWGSATRKGSCNAKMNHALLIWITVHKNTGTNRLCLIQEGAAKMHCTIVTWILLFHTTFCACCYSNINYFIFM
jgi:hypothetical protein